MAEIAFAPSARNPPTRSPSEAPSLGVLARTVPVFAHPAMPVAYAFDDATLYVRPGLTAETLAAALWAFLRDVGGFGGERPACVLDAARERLTSL